MCVDCRKERFHLLEFGQYKVFLLDSFNDAQVKSALDSVYIDVKDYTNCMSKEMFAWEARTSKVA